MSKYHFLFISIILLNLFINIHSTPSSIDLSDDNPVVYCLKAVKRYTFDEIKEYLLRTQVPEEAEDYAIDDPEFSWCIEQRSKED